MKNSEELMSLASKEDNDIISFALQCKALREKRSEKFLEDWLPLLKIRYPVEFNNHKYSITTQKFGIIDYFPKANSLLIRKDNEWEKPGLKWMINHLMK
jgi:hypothetical protein